MKANPGKLITIALSLAVILLYSCRKTDLGSTISIQNVTVAETKFFNSHRTNQSKETEIVEYLKRLNKKENFVEKTIERIGYPRWDKMIHQYAKAENLSARGQGSADVYFIPFVRDSADVVNASMILTTTGTDTTIRYLCDWQYRDSVSTGLSSRSQFLLLMNLDKNVFGERVYKIKDTIAFGKDENNKTISYIKLAGDTGSITNNLMVATTVSVCYWYWHQTDQGQVTGGCNPELDHCLGYVKRYRCDTYTVWTFVEEGGGSGGGSTGGGGSPGGGSLPPECGTVPVDPFTAGRVVDPCDEGPGWEPLPIEDDPFTPYVCNYQLTQHEQEVFNQIDTENYFADQNHQNLDCHGTKRTGNLFFKGTKEHWLIQLDYVSKNPVYGDVEFAIPNSSPNGNRGYADIVDLQNKSIFEIKPNNLSGQTSGATEVANYVAKANQFCGSNIPMGVPWSTGINYTPTLLPTGIPNRYLKSQLYSPGVIVYSYENISNPNPAPPVVVPTTVGQKFKHLVERLKQNFNKADEIIAEYLQQNPDLVTYIKTAAIGAGVAIIVGTIIEDFLTLGAGIADDWACFVLAYRIIRFAVAL